MPKSFPGFSPKALTFFRQLQKNNTREWFQPRKDQYIEQVRTPMIELVTLICEDLRHFAVDHVSDPAKAIYRIHRDTRFSKDKTPYKTHIAAMFRRSILSRNGAAGFYFGVSHEGVEIAGGMYMPEPEELAAVRAAIDRNGKKLQTLIEDKKLRKLLGDLQGTQLARVPKGYAPDHSYADLLRRKQIYFYKTLKPSVALGKTLRKEIVERFKAVAPPVNFINEAILAARKDEENGEDDRPKRPEPMF